MGLRTCKRCGKKYDPTKGNACIGSYCSNRCFELDMKQKQQELDRKSRERERRSEFEKRRKGKKQSAQLPSRSSNQSNGNGLNAGCGIIGVVVLFLVGLLVYGKGGSDDSNLGKDIVKDSIVVDTAKKEIIGKHQIDTDLEDVNSFFIDDDSSINYGDFIEDEEESLQIEMDSEDVCL